MSEHTTVTTSEVIHKDLSSQYEYEISELKERLQQSENAREGLKNDLEETNQHVIQLEEDLFQSKHVQIDMLEQMKLIEDQLEDGLNEIERLKALNL